MQNAECRPRRLRFSITLLPAGVMLKHNLLILLAAGFCLPGCAGLFRLPGGAAPAPIENPLFVPPLDREFLWNQTVDAVDDYFRIEREERVRLVAGVLTEGRIETFPVTGSTLFEP